MNQTLDEKLKISGSHDNHMIMKSLKTMIQYNLTDHNIYNIIYFLLDNSWGHQNNQFESDLTKCCILVHYTRAEAVQNDIISSSTKKKCPKFGEQGILFSF